MFALACFSRETALATLLPLAALAVARHQGNWRRAGKELATVVATGVLVAAWILTTPRYLQLADYSLLGRPFWSSVIAQIGAVPVGLGLMLRPAALSIDYGVPMPVSSTDPLFVAGLLLYIAAAAGIVFFHRRSRGAAVGLAVWLAALLPTQSVIPKLDALTNRPLSLALAGLLLAAAPAVGAVQRSGLARSASTRGPSLAGQWPAVPAICALGAVAAWLTAATAQRAELFQSNLRLWQDAAAKSRVNERPYVQYAVLLNQEGRNREALEALAIAATIKPLSLQIDTLSRVYRRQEVSP
jgi:hypothetical protein